MDWLRWYQGTVTDPKWRCVSRDAGATGAEVVAVWACMMEHANKAEPRGTLNGWRDKVYGMLLDMPAERVAAIREAMQELVLEGEALAAWEKRQPQHDATAADRMRRYRERKAPEPSVTERNVTERYGALRSVTTEEKRVEEKREGESVAAPPPKRVVALKSKRVPESWEPNEQHYELAQRLGVDIEAELEKFRDHTFREAKSDWDAAFRNWLRKAPQFGGMRQAVGAPTLDAGVWG